jgi:chromosomal replication initiator protein DnaA
MGLFDRFFKKKKKPRASSGQSSQRTTRPPAGRQIKGPPGGAGNAYNTSQGYNVSGSPYYQERSNKQQLDAESRRILEDSISKISGPGSGSAVKRPPQTTASRTQASTQSGVRQTSQGLKDASIARSRESGAPPAGKVVSTKKPIVDDMSGEEELFRKLIQMDKELQQKIVAKKTKPASTAAPAVKQVPGSAAGPSAQPGARPAARPAAKPARPMEKRPSSAKDLKRKERELRKLEAKLKEKEKKLKERENVNQMFSQLQDAELEQFTTFDAPGGGAGTVAAGKVAEAPTAGEVGAAELEPTEDVEDLYQPLKNLNFNNFIVGPSNRFAHDVALSVAKAPADAYNPLFIYSEVGLGKTHLLCAIGNYIKGKNPNTQIVYVSSEKFTNELLDFLRLGEMEKFRSKYRNVDVLLIDDIQFIGGQEGTQEEFFHTFNSLYNAHKQIVITSDRPPKNIAHLKDRLRSRFEGGLIVNIKLPDLGTRTMILHEKAEKDGIYIPDEIINYIAAKVKSNVRTLIGVLNRIVAHSSLSDRELDKALVDDVLRDVVDEGIDIQGA